MRFGIGQRIFCGLALIALVLSIFLWLTLDRFDAFRDHFEQVSQHELPDLVIASKLEQEAALLVVLTQDILLPREQYLLADVKKLSEQSVSRALNLIADLESNNGINEQTALLALQYRHMADNQLALVALKEKQLHLTKQQEGIHRRLADLIKELNNGTLFIPEQPTATARSAIYVWRSSVFRAVSRLLAARNTRYQRHIEQYAKEFEQDIAAASRALSDQSPEIMIATLEFNNEIEAYGTGDENLFTLHIKNLELQNQLGERLFKGRNLAAVLLADSLHLHENVKKTVLNYEAEISEDIDQFRIILLILAAMIVLSLATIYLFVRRSVINRILMIQKELHANSAGNPIHIEETGDDELTSMAAEINYFLGEIQERELQLKKAAKEADAANKAKSEFIANMSHEIRTPMNAIINLTVLSLEAPLDTRLDSRRKGWLEIVRRSSESLLNLTNDILDSAKVEAGKLELNPVVFSLSDLLAKLEPHQVEAESKGLDFTINVEHDIPEYWSGDSQRLGQILINLVSNAIKFTKQGTVEVEVEFCRNAGEQWLLFKVRDSGIGIREDKLESIFNPFNQADNSTTRIYGGTGLGLTVSRQLVELMGGRIQAECRLGEGSVFQVVLPLESAAAEDVSEVVHVPDFTLTEAVRDRFAGRAVLLVEDNPFNQIVAEELLTLAGITADIAEDGLKAVETVTSKKYDLILMDLHMPRMDGFEAALAIRDLPCCAGIPIIILTADANHSVRERCLQAGMNDIITKPINNSEFFQTIGRWLSRNSNGAEKKAEKKEGDFAIKKEKSTTKRMTTDDEPTLFNNPIILRAFIDNHDDTIKRIRKALADADQKKAHRLAHNLKSAAGTVKAEQLCRLMQELEDNLSEFLAENDETAANKLLNTGAVIVLDRAERELLHVLERITLYIS